MIVDPDVDVRVLLVIMDQDRSGLFAAHVAALRLARLQGSDEALCQRKV
jgi:hypothetical protein